MGQTQQTPQQPTQQSNPTPPTDNTDKPGSSGSSGKPEDPAVAVKPWRRILMTKERTIKAADKIFLKTSLL